MRPGLCVCVSAVERDGIQRFVALVDHGTAAVPYLAGVGWRVLQHIFSIEQIRLAGKRARHPLPAQVVARQVTVEQVAVQPISPGAPMHLAQMHHVAGQPHTRVVVQITRGVQGAHGVVNRGYTGTAFANVWRQHGGVVAVPRRLAMHVLQNRITAVSRAAPDMVKKFTPAKFKHQLVVKLQRMALANAACRICQGQDAVGQIGGQTRHRPIQSIAGARIDCRVDGIQPLHGGLVRGLECLQVRGYAQKRRIDCQALRGLLGIRQEFFNLLGVDCARHA